MIYSRRTRCTTEMFGAIRTSGRQNVILKYMQYYNHAVTCNHGTIICIPCYNCVSVKIKRWSRTRCNSITRRIAAEESRKPRSCVSVWTGTASLSPAVTAEYTPVGRMCARDPSRVNFVTCPSSRGNIIIMTRVAGCDPMPKPAVWRCPFIFHGAIATSL